MNIKPLTLRVRVGILFLFFSITNLFAQSYKWDNVAVGGGGYIIGIVIHPKNPALIYVRTDVGGAYKWDPQEKRLKQMMNWIPYEQSNLFGTAGLAVDPSNENIVYTASGKYKNFTPSDVLKSTDQGKTWTRMNLNKSFGGNAHPNRKGKPLAVNPHKPKEVWAGTLGDGLWKYNYKKKRWDEVKSVPAGESIRAVVFDPKDSKYVYVAVRGEGVYRSTNKGKTFSKVGDAPTTISDMSLSKDGDILYVSAWDNGVHKLVNPKTSDNWKNISPPETSNRTVSASPHDNKVVMTFKGEYGSINYFYVSTDAGETWTQKSGSVDRKIPWHPDGYAGSAVSQIAFDPVDPKKVYFSDWYSFYVTEDWTASTVQWTNSVGIGHEEIVTAVLSPAHPDNPAGAILYSGSADVGGLTHTALRSYPTKNYGSMSGNDGAFIEVTGLDFAESDKKFMAVVGGTDWGGGTGHFGYSTDGGATVKKSSGYEEDWGDGRVAIAGNNAKKIVVATHAGVKYSTNAGLSFKSSSGAPSKSDMGIGGIFNYRHILASDRKNGNFYIYTLGGDFYKSTNGGKKFSKVSSLPASNSSKIYLKAAPYHANHVWAALGGAGLHKSTDGGSNWTEITDFKDASMLAFGKEAPGKSYPAIYVWGKLDSDSEYWFYRSIDGGSTWEKINDENNRIGNDTQAFAADRNVYGRVFVGTNGTGIWYGEIDNNSSARSAITLTEAVPFKEEAIAYPNPTDGEVSLVVQAAKAENIQIQVTDVVSRHGLNKLHPVVPGKNTVPVDMRSLPNGTYLIKVIKSDGTATYRVVLEN